MEFKGICLAPSLHSWDYMCILSRVAFYMGFSGLNSGLSDCMMNILLTKTSSNLIILYMAKWFYFGKVTLYLVPPSTFYFFYSKNKWVIKLPGT